MRLREEHQKNQYLKQIVKQSVPEEVFLTKGMQVTIQKNYRQEHLLLILSWSR